VQFFIQIKPIFRYFFHFNNVVNSFFHLHVHKCEWEQISKEAKERERKRGESFKWRCGIVVGKIRIKRRFILINRAGKCSSIQILICRDGSSGNAFSLCKAPPCCFSLRLIMKSVESYELLISENLISAHLCSIRIAIIVFYLESFALAPEFFVSKFLRQTSVARKNALVTLIYPNFFQSYQTRARPLIIACA
jgi:hypothetical protein